MLGDGGWLFYADTLEDFQGTNPMTGRALFCAARNLALLQEYCAQQGTKFLFVCAPNKNTSYPEYMPGQYRKTEQVSDLDRLEQALTAAGRLVLRPARSALGARKPDLLSDGQPLERLRLVSCRQANPAGARERSGHRRRFAIHAAARGRSLRDALSGRPTGRRMRLPRRSCARFPISAMCAGRTIS